MVTRDEQGHLSTSVYRKVTHTDQYLSYSSHHPTHQKLGVVRTLARRALDVTTSEADLNKEQQHLKDAFHNCHYPEWIIHKGWSAAADSHKDSDPPESNDTETDERSRGFVTLPYVQGTTEAVSRVLTQAGFRVAMKPCRTLRQELVAPKDKVDTLDKSGVVYQIRCQECDSSYIGHTSKNLKDRVKQHRTATEKGRMNDSAIAEHAWKAHHAIDWENVKVLDQETVDKRRQIKESLLIRSLGPEMNRDLGLEVTPAYRSFIQTNTGGTDGISRGLPSDVTTQ